MAQSIRRSAMSALNARALYRELGELTEAELLSLRHEHSQSTRETYLRNIYGHHASWIARQVYSRWAATHRCDNC